MRDLLETQSYLDSIETYLQEFVAPQAEKIDRDPKILKSALKGMGDRNLLALKVPQNLGGGGWNELEYRRLQILMARYSGALTFLQTQHQSAASQLAKSDNLALQAEYLPQMGNGKKLVGVGFSHLRRRGKPMITASPVAEGYILQGDIPWITGFDFFNDFIVGATLPDGRELYGILPLKNTTDDKLSFSSPMSLIAITATNTVSAKSNNYLLKSDRIVTIRPPGSIHISSRQNILHHGFYALGCAYAGIDILRAIEKKKQLSFLQESAQKLLTEVKECDRNIIAALTDKESTYRDKLKLRSQTINLASLCAHAAVIAASGSANALDSPAGRVYREALLFSVSGQTRDVMEGSLAEKLNL